MTQEIKKAILIDAENQKVETVLIGDGIQPIYDAVKCEIFECVDIDGVNTIYVDEEGLLTLTPNKMFFTFEGAHQPFAGNGLILGTDNETGESIDTNLTLDEVRAKVTFLTLAQVRQMFK
jgi:hypothetical protein